jgi:2'-5' RNA ligase
MKKIYDRLWETGFEKLSKNECGIDPNIDSINDNRRGLTLIFRLSPACSKKIVRFQNGCRSIEPGQYFYPEEDFHVTFLSLISCTQNLKFEEIETGTYSGIIEKVLIGKSKFNIEHKGITLTDSCVMVQGFAPGYLNELRDILRAETIKASVRQSIDKRYILKTAHTTIIRFKNNLKNSMEFVKYLEAERNTDFGNSEINKIELVYNDWYMKKENTVKIKEFVLK